jgi:hypothetical protein
MGKKKHIQPTLTMNATAIVESARGFVSFYDPLNALIESHDEFWPRVGHYCSNLEHYPAVMEALSRLNANSMMDFEKGLFCSIFSVLIADQLDVEDRRKRALFYAGLTQDIGLYMDDYRIGDYFSLMRERVGAIKGPESVDGQKSHALVAYSLLEEAISDDTLVAELVLHHHANEDGTGYPHNIGEQQLNLEMQILVVANQVSDLVMKRDGFDSLFDCRSPLKLASTMFFKRVNGAAYSLLKAAALRLDLDHSAPVNKERLAEQVALLASFVREAVSLSGELVSAEHYRSVRLLRSRIKKLDLLMNESGLLNVLDDECLNEARLCMEALPDFLEPTQRLLKEAQEVLPSSRSAAISQLNITLKTLLATLTKPRPFSLFI